MEPAIRAGAQKVYLCKKCHNCESHVLIVPTPPHHKNVLLPGLGCGFVSDRFRLNSIAITFPSFLDKSVHIYAMFILPHSRDLGFNWLLASWQECPPLDKYSVYIPKNIKYIHM